ncbi:MAG: magnesium protoporphyrin IX methyltransferase [Betaproteobacteria bacterium]|nr:magnesium protoporphyrin IX methyltransferase [Betaproteobacteria bacterium]
MEQASYQQTRAKLEEYFDRTAADQWAKLTSEAPVSGIRATVRAGRDRMRQTLLSWLPHDLHGKRVLDAGCGTGAMACELAKRGAEVVAIDLSPTLVDLARERSSADPHAHRIQFVAGDMLADSLGEFDHVVAMDSVIHYERFDMVAGLARLAQRTHGSVVFTFAPSNALLAAMIRIGRIFPRSDRAPFIAPVSEVALRDAIADHAHLAPWRVGRTEKISSGFYTSQAMELHP